MGRVNYIEVANTREVIGYEEAIVPVVTNSIDSGKPIHDGLIVFSNVFSHETNSIVVPKAFIVKEIETEEALKKNELTIHFVLDSGAKVQKNTNVQFEDVKFITEVSFVATGLYEEFYNLIGKKIWAVSYKKLESEYYIKKLNSESLYFYLTAGANFVPYTQNTKLIFGMFYKLL